MISFKQYIIEINEFGEHNSSFGENFSSSTLHTILNRLLTRTIYNPKRIQSTKGKGPEQFKKDQYNQKEGEKIKKIDPSFTTIKPQFSFTNEDEIKRTYTWNNWSTAMQSLEHSIDFRRKLINHVASGTGRFIDQSSGIDDNHKEIINQFKNQHKILISQLIGRHPQQVLKDNQVLEFHKHIVHILMTKHNQSLDQIHNIQFNMLRDKSRDQVQHRETAYNRLPYEKGTSHELGASSIASRELLDNMVNRHNQQVSNHNHPLGFFLSGGYRQYYNRKNKEAKSLGGGFYKPESVSENGVDVTAKIFPHG